MCPRESAALTLTSNLSFRVVSRLRAQFSRDLQQSSSQQHRPADQNSRPSLRALGDPRFFPARPANTACMWRKPSAWKAREFLEVRRRRAAHLDLQLLSFAQRRRIHFRSHQGKSLHLRAYGIRPGTHAAARLRASGPALLPAEFRSGGDSSRHQRVLRIRPGHDPRHRSLRAQPGRAIRLADLHHERIAVQPAVAGRRQECHSTPTTSRLAWAWPTPSEISARW